MSQNANPVPDRSQLRASDADRERVVAELREGAAVGRLSPEEFDERMTAAYGARTYGELDQLIADLPRARPAQAALHRQSEERVRGLAQSRRELKGNIASYVSVNLLLVGIWLVTSIASGHLNYFWPIWPMLGWGIGVATHAWHVQSGADGPAGHDR